MEKVGRFLSREQTLPWWDSILWAVEKVFEIFNLATWSFVHFGKMTGSTVEEGLGGQDAGALACFDRKQVVQKRGFFGVP